LNWYPRALSSSFFTLCSSFSSHFCLKVFLPSFGSSVSLLFSGMVI
jgi:hypothetical protein